MDEAKCVVKQGMYRWNDSVNVLTATHALTKRSKVIPGGGPYCEMTPEAWPASTLCESHSTQSVRGGIE